MVEANGAKNAKQIAWACGMPKQSLQYHFSASTMIMIKTPWCAEATTVWWPRDRRTPLLSQGSQGDRVFTVFHTPIHQEVMCRCPSPEVALNRASNRCDVKSFMRLHTPERKGTAKRWAARCLYSDSMAQVQHRLPCVEFKAAAMHGHEAIWRWFLVQVAGLTVLLAKVPSLI